MGRARESMAPTYTAAAFQQASGLSVRTIREWVRRKILPRPLGKGRGTRYTPRHLVATHVIRHLRESGASLIAIRERIAGLTEEQLRALLPPEPPRDDPFGEREVRAGSPAAGTQANPLQWAVPRAAETTTGYQGKTLEVVELMDGLMLLVRRDRGGLLQRVAEEICRHYSVRPVQRAGDGA